MLENLIPVVAIPVVVIVVVFLLFSMWKKVPQDRAGVITGLKKRVITGGGGLVVPGLERIDYISLGNIPLHVETRKSLAMKGVPISVCTTAVIKVSNSTDSILTAIEQFTGRNEAEIIKNIEETAVAVLEGKLREIIATMTVEDLYANREGFSGKVQEVVGTELGTMGLEVKNFTITDISDENGYIKALGEGTIAQRKKDAEIQKAEAQREQDEKTSENVKLGEQAKIKAETEIKEAEKVQQVKQAAFNEEQAKAQAKAELAHEIQTSITQKEVIQAQMDAELVKQQREKEIAEARIQVEIAQAQKNTELAEQKAVEKEKQLVSEVVKPAEAEKERQAREADAQKYTAIKRAEAEAEKKKIDAEAEAQRKKVDALAEAEAIKVKAQAEAEAITAKAKAEADATATTGKAEAEAIEAKGKAEAETKKAALLAEAEGLEKKADALKKMSEADSMAKMQMLVDILPQVAGAIAKPMEQIDKISIIGNADGVSEVAGYVPTALAKTIETVKETTGFDLVDSMKATTIQAQTDRNVKVDGLEGASK